MSELLNSLSEAWQIAIVFTIVLPFVIGLFKWLVKPNREFFKIIKEFNSKLPPKHKKAKEDNVTFKVFTYIDTTDMDLKLTSHEIDLFVRSLETFNYNRIFFRRKAIIRYSNNIQRIIREAPWEKFGIANVQKLLDEDSNQKSKPYLLGQHIGKFLGF